MIKIRPVSDRKALLVIIYCSYAPIFEVGERLTLDLNVESGQRKKSERESEREGELRREWVGVL